MEKFVLLLKQATPKSNVVFWVITTILYAFSILINEQFKVIHDIGLSEKTEAVIKMFGTFLYIFLTAINFSQTQKLGGDNPPPDKDDK